MTKLMRRTITKMELFILGFACISLIVTLSTIPEKQVEEPAKEEKVEE